MSLRKRVSLVAAAAVAIAVVLAAGVCYLVVSGQLRGQVDGTLRDQSLLVMGEGSQALGGGAFPGLPANAGGRAPYSQIVASSGAVLLGRGGTTLPVDDGVRAVAGGSPSSTFEDVHVGDEHLRMYAFHDTAVMAGGQQVPVAVQLARPLEPVDHVLSKLRLILLVVALGGVALAAALGRLAARRVLSPLAEVTEAAQHIGETDDLSRRIGVHAEDEVGALARRFNAMLERLESSRAALDASVRAQRQLVADASHELRTPVTSLRTNIEVLLAHPDLEPEDRGRLLADVVEQCEELSALVGDLIELGRGDLPLGSYEEVRLDRVVEESVARARRNSPWVRFEVRTEPVIVEGLPERLGRAINNLLDNAARHSSPEAVVEVSLDPAGVRVRDHGPGLPEQDLPHVFDRFFRGANARGEQGSGLGLAIVRQVAEQHGGSVSAANVPQGGAEFTLQLPAVAAESAASASASASEAQAPEPAASL